MQKTLFNLALCSGLFFFFSACKKTPEKLGITATFDISSAYSNKDYSINIFYPDEAFPTDSTPIIYLLDGYWYEKSVTRYVADLAEEGEIPKCILVSIAYQDGGYKDRTSDLPYPDPKENPIFAGDKFFNFLKMELVPEVESQYPSDTSRRTILGHSYGGIFVLCSLFENAAQPLFKNCVSASASLMLGTDNYIFTKEQKAADSINDLPVNLFITYGEFERGPDTDMLHIELYDRLVARNYASLDVELTAYPKTHNSNPYPSFKNGLIYVFNH